MIEPTFSFRYYRESVSAPAQIDELARALSYERLKSRIPKRAASDLLENITVKARLVGALPELEVSADPNDNVMLAIRVAGQVDLVVSGDKRHVLPLGTVEGIPIITARVALTRLKLDPAGA